MRTSGADRKELLAAPHEEDGLVSNQAGEHHTVLKVCHLHSVGEVRGVRRFTVGHARDCFLNCLLSDVPGWRVWSVRCSRLPQPLG
jgi:hypothetical protein